MEQYPNGARPARPQFQSRSITLTKRNGPSAFTLIELLVVIAVIGVLAALLLPALRSAMNSARRTSCMGNIAQIGMGFQGYLQDYSETFPAADDPVSASPMYWLWMGRGWRPLLSPYLSEPKVFWCPTDTAAVAKFETTSFAYSMAFYHSPAQINAMTTSAATYSNPQPTVPQRLPRVRLPSQKVLAGEWTSNHRPVAGDNGWWNWGGARNMLFVDGHVEFCDAERIRAANDGFPDVNLTVNGIWGFDVQP